jgi:myosin heavy subunit
MSPKKARKKLTGEVVSVKVDVEEFDSDLDSDDEQETIMTPTATLVPHESLEPGDLNNLTALTNLHEAPVLAALRGRFCSDEIYTWTGSTLISINPFKRLPIYSKMTLNMYKGSEPQAPGLDPHVFSIAESAYQVRLAVSCTDTHTQ